MRGNLRVCRHVHKLYETDSYENVGASTIGSFYMNVIFYSSTINERTKEICGVLENPSHEIGLELHHSTSSLERRLRQPLNGIALVVLYISSKKDLSDMLALRELIIGLPLILIMINTAGEAMTKGRILRPRVIFGADDNLEDVGLVFERMLARQKQLRTVQP